MEPLQGNARELLIELISDQTGDVAEVLARKFAGLDHNQDAKLRATISYLIRKGYLDIPRNGWADNVPYIASLTYEGENYLELEGKIKGTGSEVVSTRTVFIVHGHDDAMKYETARLIERLGYEPVILHEKADGGKTIIEKFEQHSEKLVFAIILYSPDDKTENGNTRARQNVVFEHGYFVGKLGRQRVVCLYKQHESFEFPSDLSGILYKQYDLAGGWKYQLSNEMKAAGLKIDMNAIG